MIFLPSDNPNGAGSYGHDGTLFTAAQGGQSIGPGVTGWQGVVTGSGFGVAKFIDQNASRSTFQWLGGLIPIPNNTLMLDPQLGNVYVVFTAPSSGKYKINGSFFGDNTSEESHSVMILVDGNSLWSATIAAFNQPDAFGLSETLAAGDTVTFEVATGSDGHSLGTGLVGTVTRPGIGTPEPAT